MADSTRRCLCGGAGWDGCTMEDSASDLNQLRQAVALDAVDHRGLADAVYDDFTAELLATAIPDIAENRTSRPSGPEVSMPVLPGSVLVPEVWPGLGLRGRS